MWLLAVRRGGGRAQLLVRAPPSDGDWPRLLYIASSIRYFVLSVKVDGWSFLEEAAGVFGRSRQRRWPRDSVSCRSGSGLGRELLGASGGSLLRELGSSWHREALGRVCSAHAPRRVAGRLSGGEAGQGAGAGHVAPGARGGQGSGRGLAGAGREGAGALLGCGLRGLARMLEGGG